MRRSCLWVLSLTILAAVGCGAQDILLETEKGYLFTVADVLAVPGEEAELRARLQAGDLLSAQGGYVVRFHREGQLFKAAETGGDGTAVVAFRPEAPGDYVFTAELSPNGFPGAVPEPVALRVACRPGDAPMVIVDLDKTLVAGGFQQVLIGQAEPMPGSQRVMKRLAERYTVAYLTHRPDYFGPKSKAWLRRNEYPSGPVLLSGLGGFLKGSEAFKSGVLAELQKQFRKIELGIGDKISDARAYHEHGLKAFAIVRPEDTAPTEELQELLAQLKALPDAVQVVGGWDEIESAVFDQASFPPSRMRQRIGEMLDARQAREKPQPAGGR